MLIFQSEAESNLQDLVSEYMQYQEAGAEEDMYEEGVEVEEEGQEEL